MPQTNFKLLAIRPLNGCSQRFLKNLTEEHIYKFYSSASFFNRNKEEVRAEDEVVFINHLSKMPGDFFSIQSADNESMSVNISAVAGRNGAGKSTLIELLFAAIYAFSVTENILEPNIDSLDSDGKLRDMELSVTKSKLQNLRKTKSAFLKDIAKDISPRSLSKSFESIKDKFSDYIKQEQHIISRIQFLKDEIKDIQIKKTAIDEFCGQLKIELYYQLGKLNYCLSVNAPNTINRIEVREIGSTDMPASRLLDSGSRKDLDNDFLAKQFFYTIAVNYSHYALNANYLGEWINSLFHKNDAYRTPIVINPMRINGNFDINDEISFAKYRLLSNSLTEFHYSRKKVKITDHQYIYKVRFTLNIQKIEKLRKGISSTEGKLSGDLRSVNLITDLFARYYPGFEMGNFLNVNFPLKKELSDYIINKVDRIAELYPGFENGYRFGPEEPMLLSYQFLDKIVEDRTHVTYKLRQAVNFIKSKLEGKDKGRFYFDDNTLQKMEKVEFTYSLSQLLDYVSLENIPDVIGHLPPSIFRIDFILKNEKSKSTSSFNKLSSGEQQLIHALQSVIYHINNIQSAHHGKKERVKYQVVNIIYDEIELYFHPDYQRRFILELRKNLQHLHLKGTSRISALNILFLTHSPFILSDIPKENIMLLETDTKSGKSVTKDLNSETFAANIHTLLANGFFLQGTLMGRFAEEKLNNLIRKINKKDGRPTEDDRKLVAMIGDSYLRMGFDDFIGGEL